MRKFCAERHLEVILESKCLTENKTSIVVRDEDSSYNTYGMGGGTHEDLWRSSIPVQQPERVCRVASLERRRRVEMKSISSTADTLAVFTGEKF